jgi:ATP-dependent DNA helicase RecG
MFIRVPEFGAVKPDEQQTKEDTSNQHQVGTKLEPSRHQVEILKFCVQERGIAELMQLVGRSDRTKFRNQVLKPLLESVLLEMTIPDKPTSSKQKYRLTGVGASVVKKASSVE